MKLTKKEVFAQGGNDAKGKAEQRTENGVRAAIRRNRLAAYTALIIGLVCYLYFFTNNLMSHDSPSQLFARGAGLTSGRWGIDVLNSLIPAYMMPWLNGVIALTFLAAAAALIADYLLIREKTEVILLSGLFIAFPALTSSFLYMFAAPVNACSLFCAILSVWLFERDRKRLLIPAVLAMIVSLSIYQAFFSFALCLFLVSAVKQLLEDKDTPRKKIVLAGIQEILFVVLSLGLYYLFTQLLLSANETELSSYATSRIAGLSMLGTYLMYPWLAFRAELFYGYLGYVNLPAAVWAHGLLLALSAIALIAWAIKTKNIRSFLLVLLLCLLFPWAVNALYLISGPEAPTSMTQYSFCTFYLLCWALLKQFPKPGRTAFRLCGAVILFFHILTANEVAMYEYGLGENMRSFYQSVVTQIKETPGFDANAKVALIGKSYECQTYNSEYSNIMAIMGVDSDVNIWSKTYYIRNYLGFDVPYASEEEKAAVMATEEYAAMPVYPYYGSVREINGIIVVNFGQ